MQDIGVREHPKKLASPLEVLTPTDLAMASAYEPQPRLLRLSKMLNMKKPS